MVRLCCGGNLILFFHAFLNFHLSTQYLWERKKMVKEALSLFRQDLLGLNSSGEYECWKRKWALFFHRFLLADLMALRTTVGILLLTRLFLVCFHLQSQDYSVFMWHWDNQKNTFPTRKILTSAPWSHNTTSAYQRKLWYTSWSHMTFETWWVKANTGLRVICISMKYISWLTCSIYFALPCQILKTAVNGLFKRSGRFRLCRSHIRTWHM